MQKKKSRIKEKQLLLSEEQTLLAKERTILSFMQTGLAFIAVGVVIANYFEDLIIDIIGYLLIVIGFVEVLESIRRLRKKQKQLEILKKEGSI